MTVRRSEKPWNRFDKAAATFVGSISMAKKSRCPAHLLFLVRLKTVPTLNLIRSPA
jgi:hypothetical protein